MGAKQPKKTDTPKEDEVEQKINHPKFLNSSLQIRDQEQAFINLKLPIANQVEYKQWVSALKSAPQDGEPFLLPISHSFQKEGLCGSSGFVNIEYHGFPFLLSEEIENRRNLQSKYFQEPELWYLVYTLILACNEFHVQGKKVGDIRPQNIFINSDGQVKVATHLTWPSESTNYHKTFYEKQTTYLSPEQLKDIQFAKIEPSADFRLAETFSVGLTCLDTATLTSSNNFYLKGSKFSYEDLDHKLCILQQIQYSQLLSLVLRNLCECDPTRRSTCSELYSWLKPYEEYIINLERFEVERLPEKIQLASTNTSQVTTKQYASDQLWQQRQDNNQNMNVIYPPSNIGLSQNQVQGLPYPVSQNTYTYNNPPSFQNSGPRGPITHQQQASSNYQQQNSSTYQQQNSSSYQQQNSSAYQQQNSSTYQQQSPSNYQSYHSQNTQPSSIRPDSQEQAPIQAPGQYQYTSSKMGYVEKQPESGPHKQYQLNDQVSKSNMQMSLKKIDEQLQMSRKMFPS